MSEIVRQFYASEVLGGSVTLSPINGLDTRPAAPALSQVTLSVNTLQSPCGLFIAASACPRYEVIVRRIG